MPFIGTTPTQGFVSSFPKQSFTPNGSTTVFTLTNPVATANDLEVFVGNVRQEPTAAYTAAGTTLTMTEAPDTGLNFYVINKSFAQVTTNTPDNSVSTAKLINSAVTNAKIASGVDASKLTTGDLPISSFPAGTIVQVVRSVGTTEYSNTSNSTYVEIADIRTSITPKFANSILFFQMSGNVFKNGMSSGQSAVDFLLQDHTNSVTKEDFRGINFHNQGSGYVTQSMQYFCFNFTESASNTTAREYKLVFRIEPTYNNFSTVKVGWNGDNGSPQSMAIYEIAQ